MRSWLRRLADLVVPPMQGKEATRLKAQAEKDRRRALEQTKLRDGDG